MKNDKKVTRMNHENVLENVFITTGSLLRLLYRKKILTMKEMSDLGDEVKKTFHVDFTESHLFKGFMAVKDLYYHNMIAGIISAIREDEETNFPLFIPCYAFYDQTATKIVVRYITTGDTFEELSLKDKTESFMQQIKDDFEILKNCIANLSLNSVTAELYPNDTEKSIAIDKMLPKHLKVLIAKYENGKLRFL